ncbi:MAG: hypothetical protein HYY40_08375 [Bacteroidetes bacterium]|nr:hypothetical protein [Bacteroidota bacterium]
MNISTIFSAAFLLLLVFAGRCFATADSIPKEKQKSFLKLEYFNLSDYSIELVATLNIKVKNRLTPVENVIVHFGSLPTGSEKKLGTAYTSEKGKAVLNLPEDDQLQKDTSGYYHFAVMFEGDNSYSGSSAEIAVKDIDFDLNLTRADTVRIISITASEINNAGAKIPMEEIDVYVYVKRLFGLLKVSEDPVMIENGESNIEFTIQVPGDTLGNIGIVARIEDHELFGNVERMKVINWGVPTFPEPPVVFRAQWFQSYGIFWLATIIILPLAYLIYRHYSLNNKSTKTTP